MAFAGPCQLLPKLRWISYPAEEIRALSETWLLWLLMRV